MQLVVGRIGKAHGVKGEVAVDVRTDDPEHRFAPGSVLGTDPEHGQLVVLRARPHAGRLLVQFESVADRDAAETLRGTLLVADSATVRDIADDDEWWDHQLVGLRVVTTAGADIGEVIEVVHIASGSLLSVQRPGGEEALIPFVNAIVPQVDIASGRITIDPPPGLLDPERAVIAGSDG